jgi:LPXTG-motif cell wall-anchored protein
VSTSKGKLPNTGLPLALPALGSLGLGCSSIAGLKLRGKKQFVEENL